MLLTITVMQMSNAPQNFSTQSFNRKKKKEKRTENFSQEKQTEDTVKAIKIDYI